MQSKSEAMRERREQRMREQGKAFDVTCVIGTVVMTPDGERHPNECAFELIAKHDAPGTFTFPGPHGEIAVTVEHR
jgi:hypothetical protein